MSLSLRTGGFIGPFEGYAWICTVPKLCALGSCAPVLLHLHFLWFFFLLWVWAILDDNNNEARESRGCIHSFMNRFDK